MFALVAVVGMFVGQTPKEIVLEAGGLKRVVELQPHFRTKSISNTKTGRTLQVAADTPEFIVETTDRKRFTTEDFVVRSTSNHDVVLLQHRSDESLRIDVDCSDPKEKNLRRRLTLHGFGPIQRLCVEAFKAGGRGEIGGLGQPLFLNDEWFFGLEHPAGINRYDAQSRCILLQQHPSNNQSMDAVVGGLGSKSERVEDAFERYIDSIRRREPRPLVQYNTWYDLRDAELTPKNALEAADVLRAKLRRPLSFVVDDGWQNPKSLWAPRDDWKSGIDELANRIGVDLGLWLPLSGASLDVSYGKAKGYPTTNFRKPSYCLSSKPYRVAVIERLKQLQQSKVDFFKHDFNYLTCSSDGHDHPPTPVHGREANVDGQIEILNAVKCSSAVTSNAWPSPYWLKHTDFLWIGSYDYAEDWSVPCWSKRQAEMTFRDAQIHRLLRIDRAQVPMSALMTHGLIKGRHQGSNADRDINDWADNVMMFLGRGVMLQELYVTPSLLTDDEWRILNAALSWAHRRASDLKHTRMIGGRPDCGEPYGYMHWSGGFGIACLRNPSPRPATLTLTLNERPTNFTKHDHWSAERVYPARRQYADLRPNRPVNVALAGHEVAVVEFSMTGGSETTLARDSGDSRTEVLTVERNEPDRLDWKAAFSVESGVPAEIVWWTRPRNGVYSSKLAAESAHAPKDSASTWSLHRTGWIRQSPLETWIWLPWSPFYPQEVGASVVVRTERTIDAKPSMPAWPYPETRPSHVGVEIEETLLLDDWRFSRRRGWPERLGWVLALGVLPAAVVFRIGRRVGRRVNRPRLIAALAVALLVVLYTLTPLGVGLGRVLLEF